MQGAATADAGSQGVALQTRTKSDGREELLQCWEEKKSSPSDGAAEWMS